MDQVNNQSDREAFMNDLRESLKIEAEAGQLREKKAFIDDDLQEAVNNLFIDPPYDEEENSYTEYCDVNSPQHYQKGGLEVIDIIDNFTPDPYSAYMANVIKYVLRHMDKGTPKKDLRKAKWYLERMIKEWD